MPFPKWVAALTASAPIAWPLAAEGAAALERLDWQEAVRLFVATQVADDDPLRVHILNAVEQLIAEEARA